MTFELNKTIEIIQRTPSVLYALLEGISDDWIHNNEGEGAWSVFDAVGHLIVCEQTNFITRTEIIVSDAEHKTFTPVDMKAQFELNKGKKMAELLKTFEQLRKESIAKLTAFQLTYTHLEKTAIHPKIGQFALSELLALWSVHDLTHIAQITRIMVKQYKNAVGPFIEFVTILNK